jgi:hypothetical protein
MEHRKSALHTKLTIISCGVHSMMDRFDESTTVIKLIFDASEEFTITRCVSFIIAIRNAFGSR